MMKPRRCNMSKEEKAARERVRAQLAFSEILATMGDIAREEVCNASINLWKDKLNIFQRVGEKVRINDFLINAIGADPFNADMPSHKALAEWFVEQWHRFKPGATTVHVRGLHYAISRDADTPDAIYLPNGRLYDNTDLRWQDLERAGKYARYLGLIDPEIFQDRRSRDAVVKEFVTSYKSLDVSGSYLSQLSDIELDCFGVFPEFPSFPVAPDFPDFPFYELIMRGQQLFRPEVWIEKSTQEDVLVPVCDRLGVTLLTAQGELSISSIWKAIKRAERYGPQTITVILYVSDFDPAGKSMPVAAARKLEFLRMFRRSNVNIRLYPIALTHEQCIQYQLPRTPIKEKERRRSGFEYRFGDGATELDALESLHPGELARLVEQAILRFRDPNLTKKVDERRRELNRELQVTRNEVIDAYNMDTLQEEYTEAQSALSAIENAHYRYASEYDSLAEAYAELEERYDRDVRARFNTWHQEQFELLSYKVYEVMHAARIDLYDKMPDIDTIDIPRAEDVPVDGDCLYDSTRQYVPQLATYKQFAGKFSHLIEDDEDEL